MKSFEIIEEGRLSKSEMGVIVGGTLTCTSIYSVGGNCKYDGGLANCPSTYCSCGADPKTDFCCQQSTTNPNGYIGPRGGGGLVEALPDPIALTSDLCEITDMCGEAVECNCSCVAIF